MQFGPSNLVLSVVIALAGCGGGGGGGADTTSGPTVTAAPSFPSSGIYAPVLTVHGSTTTPSVGLSLVHPDDPSVKYLIEDGAASITGTAVLQAGTVNTSAGRIDNLAPRALFYVAGGILRRIPLMANGSAPTARVRSAVSEYVCTLVLNQDRIDHADPDATLVQVTTRGPDATCGTPDDVKAAFRYEKSTDTLISTGCCNLGVIRDATTLAPTYPIYPDGGIEIGGQFWVTVVSTVPGPTLKWRRLVASAPGIAVIDLGSSDADSQLTVLTVDKVPSTAVLGQQLTGGGNWQLLGHDASAFYVYRNSGASTASTWSVVKITKKQPSAKRLATGTGLLNNAAMGEGLLYLTVQQTAANKLYSVSKTTGGLVEMESMPMNALTTVLTSANGVHQFWRVTHLDTTPSFRIDLMDEAGKLLATAPGGMPLAIAEPTSINLSRSENRTRFIYLSGLGSQGYADASLFSFDASAAGASPVALGKLPGAATFAGNLVFASAPMVLGGFGAGQVTSSSSGIFAVGGAKEFSFKVDTPSSLVFTSVTR